MSVPYTRKLASVLREQLRPSGPRTLLGTVTATPGNDRVTVNIQGATVTIPKLSTYVPVIGEPAYILADDLYTVALGSVRT